MSSRIRDNLMPRKTTALLAALLLAAAGATAADAAKPFPNAKRAGPPQFQDDAALKSAVAGAWRAQNNRARDVYRHPAESLGFWGLAPGATIVEISPGGGYWTEILAPYAKATKGRYIAAVSERGTPAFKQKFADAAVYGPIETVVFSKTTNLGAPGTADFVLTARNLHNFISQDNLDKVMADSFAVLKPGGVLAVEEHRADPRPMRAGADDGYVSEAHAIAAAERAGFKLEEKSEINANPKDTKDHPFGVWTLPPSRYTTLGNKGTDPNFDRTKYDAIGESDRMTLRFRKPG
jgi:predicted methyltransferase